MTLEVGTGEFFSLLGPSGCGKTTTLRMIGGFELPTGGRILLRGRDITYDPPDKRPVNMVFQNYALFPHLDVGDNIAFGLKRKGVAKPEIDRRVGEALELVHLEGYARRKPNQLSGGQQQRVALARALVNRPNVLLLDEPLGALDLKLRKRLQIELKRIQIEVGITFVYVTHDQEEALTMSDRIAVMNRGKVEQLGTPEALYERPATRFVADFIGTTNLLRGEVVSTEADCAVVRLESGETCPVGRAGRTVGDAVDISLRPGGDLDPRGRPRGARRLPLRRVRRLVAGGRDRAGRLPGRLGPISGPHRWRIRDDRPGPEGRCQAAGGKSRGAVLAARRGARPRRSAGGDGGDAMTHEHDGSSVDLERRLVQVMAENRLTRRQLLERMGALGDRGRAGPDRGRLRPGRADLAVAVRVGGRCRPDHEPDRRPELDGRGERERVCGRRAPRPPRRPRPRRT